MKTFSDRLKHARTLRQHTQTTLARACGLSQSTIASYESGERRSSRSFRRIANVLHVELDWLETGTGPMDQRDVYDTPHASAASTLMEDCALQTRLPPAAWPFPSVAPAQINALPATDRRELDRWLRTMVDGYLLNYVEGKERKPRG